MVHSILKKSKPQRLVEHTDLPFMSDYADRRSVLEEIRRLGGGNERSAPPEDESVEEEEESALDAPQVEITGLEILYGCSDDASDHSFDSYGRDSFDVAQDRMDRAKTNRARSRSARTPRGRRAPRRMSNCSSIGEDQSYGYGDLTVPPLSEHMPVQASASELSSLFDEDEAPDYGYGRYKATRRSSIGTYGSYAKDSVCHGYAKSTRRNSIGTTGSYAKDSVCYGRYKSTRRSSIGTIGSISFADSYAADSVKLPKTKRRMSNSSFAFSREVYESQSINTGGVGRAA